MTDTADLEKRLREERMKNDLIERLRRTADDEGCLDSGIIREAANALTAWRMDAAARLGVYVALRNSGLIGDATQVDVSLIMPTLAMLDQCMSGEYLEHCETCGAPLQWGDKVGIADFGNDDTGTICAKCAGDAAVYVHEGIDIERERARARDCLSSAQAPESSEGQ
ncbi:MAG: hypothetical protein KJZ75_11305 [Hyphomonadaceae bacterium]|nr:hypothetical protein [Hyphomonadaceae bacterium]